MRGVVVAAVVVLVGCDDGPAPPLRVGTACPAVVMREVNDRWIANHSSLGDAKWERATYFIGNMAAYDALDEPRYLQYALDWAQQHAWEVSGGTNTRNADDHAAGQVYLALYEHTPEASRIADIRASIDNVIESQDRGDWSWIDAQFMASPVFAHLGALTGNGVYYWEAMYQLYGHARSIRGIQGLYDETEGLWYRDDSYLFPQHTTAHGKKIFWSRGNGWVIGAVVRTLAHLPDSTPYHRNYVTMLLEMAEALARVQRADGLWNVSLADPDDHPGPEASGTAFFVYALAWGINEGYLDRATYLPVVERGWRALVEHTVRADAQIGLVQGVGEAPADAQPVTLRSTADYGEGAFLLAGSEVHRLGLELDCP